MSNFQNKIRAQVVKLGTVDSPSPTVTDVYKSRIDVGETFTGYFTEFPEIGQHFTLYNDGFSKSLRQVTKLITTPVKEIIDERTFVTHNSIYKITTLSDERQDKINQIFHD